MILRRALSIVPCLLAAVAFLTIPACGSRPVPEASEAAYSGPPITLDSTGAQHIVVLEAPMGGYSLMIDRVQERAGFQDIFVTVREPDPRFLHTQAVTRLRALSPLASSTAVRVCARVLAADEDPDSLEYPIAIDARR
jgi:hypothetical protein